MMNAELWTSCSNLGAFGTATKDGELYAARILDWGLHKISRLHQYPLLTVSRPDSGIPSCNIGWVGYLGAISGINAEGITLGEMGYGDPPGETLRGMPMPFMLREVLSRARSVNEAGRIIETTVGSNSYVFLMTDGKTNEGRMFIKDRNRFLAFGPDTELKDGKEHLPPIPDIVYGGRYNEKMTELLSHHSGEINPGLLMKEIIPKIVMASNFQNVIYRPAKLQFWVNNALNKYTPAAEQPYTFFDFGEALKQFQ
jgi:hypothetical protein